MTLLMSSYTAYAGMFGPAAMLSTSGQLIVSTAVTVKNSDNSTNAVLFTDQTKTTAQSNPVSTDAYGNLTFFADPGIYYLNISGQANTIRVTVNPWYADSVLNAPTTVDTASSISPFFGDVRFASAGSNNITYTLPTPGAVIAGGASGYTSGGRIRIVRTDNSSNSVTVSTPSGNIYGPGLGTSATSLVLNYQQAFVDVVSDGTNYHVVGGAQDTGWLTSVSYVTGFQTYSTNPLQYRLIGSRLQFQGGVTWYSSGAPYSVGTLTASVNTAPKVPTGTSLYFAVAQAQISYTYCTVGVAVSGTQAALSLLTTPNASSLPIYLNGVTYEVA